jgi:hypothetical protein
VAARDDLNAVLPERVVSVEKNRNDVRVEEEDGHPVGFTAPSGTAELSLRSFRII